MKKPTQDDIAKKVGADRTTVSKVLSDDPGTYTSERLRIRIFEVARELGYTSIHQRRRYKEQVAAPKTMAIPAEVAIILWDGTVVGKGKAVIRSLNADGATIADIGLKPPLIPMKPCYMNLKFTLGKDLFDLRADILRLRLGRFIEITVKFIEIPVDTAQRIVAYISQLLASCHPKR
jgi:hypothetical protein